MKVQIDKQLIQESLIKIKNEYLHGSKKDTTTDKNVNNLMKVRTALNNKGMVNAKNENLKNIANTAQGAKDSISYIKNHNQSMAHESMGSM